ncbi:gluconate 2-dehydrogenase subunit 3 family protein [Roseivirga sp. BDSF3-8]|uniref:gluconate 2-dehydrogenase subunit 3 family protein n=1 Tax=Roseivirga sp. BDSF3-8 TaxID=3241598 RepID=UPI0035323AB0
MKRREAIRVMSLWSAGAIVATELILTGCDDGPENTAANTEKKEDTGPKFEERDLAMLNEIGETIIPKTDTPGAKAVGIGSFIAMMVRDCYEPDEQQVFMSGLQKIRDGFEEQHDKIFMLGTPEEKLAFLNGINEEMAEAAKKRKAMPGKNEEKPPIHYFKMMKELTVLGYFSSQVGATEALRYIETPGRYDGCTDYEKGDRAWAV